MLVSKNPPPCQALLDGSPHISIMLASEFGRIAGKPALFPKSQIEIEL